MRDPFEVLGIERGISYRDARRVYMRRVRLLHPDRVVDDAELAAEATKLTAELTSAWGAIKSSFGASSGDPSTAHGPEPSGRNQDGRNGASSRRTGDARGRTNTREGPTVEQETADDILDWMVGAILGQAQLHYPPLVGDELLMLYRPATETVPLRPRAVRRLRRRVLPLLNAAIESDLRGDTQPTQAPSGRRCPQEWWDGYVRLDELGNESLLLFLLDDFLDPSPRH